MIMDVFTATALAHAERDAERRVAERAEEIERSARHRAIVDPGPTNIESRLVLAYGEPIPKVMSDLFIHWRLPPHPRWDAYQERQAAREIARAAQGAAAAARSRVKESAARLASLEARLAEIESRYSSAVAALKADPAPMADPLEVGQQSAIVSGCERLMAVLRREIEAAGPDPERAEREANNWTVLYDLGEVIAGITRATDSLARDLGFQEAWEVGPKGLRAQREKERREEAEHERAEAEIRRAEYQKRAAETASAEQAKQAAAAWIDSLDFAGLVSYLFFGKQQLALDEVKARVAEWNELRTFKEAIRLWPEAKDPDLLIAAWRDVSDWNERRRLDPAWRPSAEDDLTKRAARRLERLVHPNPNTLDFQRP
jgi:hypothetical protein